MTAIATLSAFTEYAFNTNPVSFVMGTKYGTPGNYGNYMPGNKLSLMELFNIGQLESNDVSAMDQIRNNLRREGALTKFIMTNVGITVLNALVKKTKVVTSFNQLSRAIGTQRLIMG